MTDINAAAARRNFGRSALIAITTVLGLGLAGCETSGSLFGGASLPSLEQQLASAPPPPVAAPVASKKVAIAPVIGAPDAVAKQIADQMTQAMTQQRIAVAASPTEQADFTLRGYIVAAREKTNTKVSYIWDVTDQAGKRVNRITGEELAPAPQRQGSLGGGDAADGAGDRQQVDDVARDLAAEPVGATLAGGGQRPAADLDSRHGADWRPQPAPVDAAEALPVATGPTTQLPAQAAVADRPAADGLGTRGRRHR